MPFFQLLRRHRNDRRRVDAYRIDAKKDGIFFQP
jgi:hypothetical protein